MFNKFSNLLLHTSILFLVSFFFIPTVKADRSYTWENSQLAEKFSPECIQSIRTSVSSFTSQSFAITGYMSSSVFYAFYFNSATAINRDSYPQTVVSFTSSTQYSFVDTTSCTVSQPSDQNNTTYTIGNNAIIVYSSTDIPLTLDTALTVTNNTNTISYSAGELDKIFPTFYNLYYGSSPPTPTDNYPILTSFYSLAIEKLGVIAEEISSNYVYLSIISIFILYCLIILIRRSLQ